MDNNYRIVDDNEYHLKETTGGTYEAIRMIELRSSFFGINNKVKILEEFGLDKEAMANELDIKKYYEELVKALFLEKCDAKFKNLNLAEVNRAKDDFFSLLNRR